MRQTICRVLSATILATAGFTVGACHHYHNGHYEGPAQHAGRHIDSAADKAGDVVEGTGRAVNRALPGD
jgi:hypothetical protein